MQERPLSILYQIEFDIASVSIELRYVYRSGGLLEGASFSIGTLSSVMVIARVSVLLAYDGQL